MSRRLFPRTFLHPWGLVGRNDRCPRCHVHRFDWEISRRELDRLVAGDSETAFGSGQCRRCCWRGGFSIDAGLNRTWYR